MPPSQAMYNVPSGYEVPGRSWYFQQVGMQRTSDTTSASLYSGHYVDSTGLIEVGNAINTQQVNKLDSIDITLKAIRRLFVVGAPTNTNVTVGTVGWKPSPLTIQALAGSSTPSTSTLGG